MRHENAMDSVIGCAVRNWARVRANWKPFDADHQKRLNRWPGVGDV